MNYVFPITYGRSGSTLLMGVLNSMDGVRVTGENNNAFTHIMSFFNDMKKARQNNDNMEVNYKCHGSKNPWWNTFSETSVRNGIRNLTNMLINPYDLFDTIGFKEIRYPSVESLGEYLTFLHLTFRPKFIFFTRNLDDVCISKWHAKNPPKCKKKLRAFEKEVQEYMNKHKEQDWFWLRYEDLVEYNELKIKELYDFLGKEFNKYEFEHIMGEVHGY